MTLVSAQWPPLCYAGARGQMARRASWHKSGTLSSQRGPHPPEFVWQWLYLHPRALRRSKTAPGLPLAQGASTSALLV